MPAHRVDATLAWNLLAGVRKLVAAILRRGADLPAYSQAQLDQALKIERRNQEFGFFSRAKECYCELARQRLIVNRSDLTNKLARCRYGGFSRAAVLGAFALLPFLAVITCASRSSEYQPSRFSSSGSGLRFAIADLDGDRRPDLAYVETGRSDASQTDYWIRLQVTAGQGQRILVVAPTGGLQIVARDVNGDHALDLVLTSAWLKQPVAILLNDGHGVFSQVDPSAFPAAFSEPGTSWGSTDDQEPGIVGVPQQSRVWGLWVGVRLPRPRSLDDGAPQSSCRFVLSSVLTPHSGRAPPSELALL